jgi:hypothetical protein
MAWLRLMSLPWGQKGASRATSGDSYIIAIGDGQQHAIMIPSRNLGLYVEDVASSQKPVRIQVLVHVMLCCPSSESRV